MSKTISRNSVYYLMVVVGAYMTCFYLLWKTVRTQKFKESSRRIHHTERVNKAMTRSSLSRSPTDEDHEICVNSTCSNKSRPIIKLKGRYFETAKRDIDVGSKKFFLTEIIMIRIYKNDLAKWTIRELKQWLHFLFYTGVEHVYLCDHFINDNERLNSSLSKYIDKGLLTYIEWPWNASSNSGNIMRHQVNCYSHVIRKYGMDSVWQMSIDMDEFPVSLKDTERLFLARFLKQTPANVSQILMPNFLMLGQGNRSKTMTIERITRITKTKANNLTKPIYRPSAIENPDIHVHSINTGSTINANQNYRELRMLHYWGARLQNWGPDTNKTIEMTEEFNLVRDHIATAVRSDLINVGEHDTFSNDTGP